jgi:hypothetical protein
MVRNSQLGIFFIIGAIIATVIIITVYEVNEKNKEAEAQARAQEKEHLIGQKDHNGNFIMTQEEIHTVKGYGLYMTTASYRERLALVGDSVRINGHVFCIIPKFDRDSLMVAMVLQSPDQMLPVDYQVFEEHMKEVWARAYPDCSFGLTKNQRDNLAAYFDNNYTVKLPVKMKGKDNQMSVSFGEVVTSESSGIRGASNFVYPVILFAETDAVRLTAEERANALYERDAEIFKP